MTLFRDNVAVSRCSGFPQGLFLRPLLFAVYVSSAGHPINSNHNQYADDAQLFLSLETSSLTADLHKLESFSLAVKAWFAENDLLLTAEKSDAMLKLEPWLKCMLLTTFHVLPCLALS